MSILINSPIIKGNKNNVVIGKDSTLNVDWSELEQECFRLLGDLPSGSEENRAIKEVLADSIQHNEVNLKATVKKHAAALSSGLFTSVAGAFIVDLIKMILHIK